MLSVSAEAPELNNAALASATLSVERIKRFTMQFLVIEYVFGFEA
jgi:hypothetical protein